MLSLVGGDLIKKALNMNTRIKKASHKNCIQFTNIVLEILNQVGQRDITGTVGEIQWGSLGHVFFAVIGEESFGVLEAWTI